MRIAIVTAVWGRPEVFRLFALSIDRLKQLQNENLSIWVVVAGSEGKTSQDMVEQAGMIYVEVPNQPLAEKHNKAMMTASLLKPDYVFCVGSDDLIHPDMLGVYIDEMKKGTDFIGVTDFYFYDLKTTRALYWGGYREAFRLGHTAGAARAMSKRLMDLWHWQPWESRHNKILDNSIQEKLNRTNHTTKTFNMKREGVFGVDIKSDINMTPINYRRLWDNTKIIREKIIYDRFPYIRPQ